MAYLRCTQCGSKALVAASQCPKCTHPFDTLDARGQRAKLTRCRSCGIMHRVDTTCHWCGDVKSGFSMPTLPPAFMRNAAAVALMITAAAGVWRFAPQLRDVAVSVAAGAKDANVADAKAASSPNSVGGAERDSYTATDVAGTLTVDSVQTADASMSAAAGGENGMGNGIANGFADSITWTPAVARTWVNVRSDASRGGQVVGVIKPSSRAMLGTDRAGWRQVRSPDVSGWVDPRLFESDSLRTRGE